MFDQLRVVFTGNNLVTKTGPSGIFRIITSSPTTGGGASSSRLSPPS
jgi:hypothetical protein